MQFKRDLPLKAALVRKSLAGQCPAASRMAMKPAFQCFPYDIFREVMLYTYAPTMPQYVVDEISFNLQIPSLPPIPASHVCRQWRHALLSDPTMWSSLSIPEIKPSGILELLNRSGSAPLNVLLRIRDPHDTSYEETEDILYALFQQIHRFKVLRLKINPPFSPPTPGYDRMQALIRNVLSYLQQPAPRLRAFSFWYENGISNGYYVDEDVFTNAFFSGDVPNLHQLHYRLPSQEPKRAEFRDLSELYVTSLRYTNYNFFLELIASSPRLELIHAFASEHDQWTETPDSADQELPNRRVDLPYLQSLRLVVFYRINLLYWFLKYVTFPPDLKWSIVSDHPDDLEESPPLLQLLSRARFTSLRLDFDGNPLIKLIFGEELGSNELCFRYSWGTPLSDLWHPLMHAIPSSCITHMHFIFKYWWEHYLTLLPEIFLSVCSLESLTVEQLCGSDWPWLGCLMTLTPVLKKTMEYVARNMPNTDTVDTTQGPGLEFIRSDSIGSEDDHAVPIPATAAFPCPRLRKINLELNHPISELSAILLRICVDTRQDEEHPLQMSVHCPEMDRSVKRILCPKKNGPIQVSIDSDD